VVSHRRWLERRLSYRDLTGASQAAHQAHWAGFTWQGGPVQVRLVGPWGSPYVWAATEAEGRRVLSHAAAIAGWDLSAGGPAEWIVATTNGSRVGQVATFRTQVKRGALMVTKRDGPSGAPQL
jgi:hypothetical protein